MIDRGLCAVAKAVSTSDDLGIDIDTWHETQYSGFLIAATIAVDIWSIPLIPDDM